MTKHTTRCVFGFLAAAALGGLTACPAGHQKATTRFSLTVSSGGSGGGTVSSAPAGIDCGTTCAHDFAAGTSVTLTATAASGSVFTGWTGACAGDGSCVVAMSAASVVTASFDNTVLPTGGSDVLGGAGSFDGAGDPAVWFLQAPDGASLDIAACAGFTQDCATITGADLGANPYDAQLIYWNATSDAPRYFTTSTTKNYTIALEGAASAAATPIRIALIDNTYTELGSSTFLLGTTPTEHVGAPIQPGASSPGNVTLRVDVGGTGNAGVSIQLDDLQVIEQTSGGPPPPTGTDLLAGDGSFDTASQQGNWWLNVPSAGTGSTAATLTFPPCPDLSGNCAVVSSPDYGGANWHTQLAFGAGSTATVTLDTTKTYRLVYKGKLTSPDSLPRSFSIWMQNNYQWPPAINYSGSLTTTAAGYDSGDLTLDTTYAVNGKIDVDFVINLGPDSDNQGTTFTFDDVQVLER
jgi:hypothetical protein